MEKLVKALLIIILTLLVAITGCQRQPDDIVDESKTTKKIITITPLSHPSLDMAIDGFVQGLSEKGYDKDKVKFEFMNANADFSRISSLVKTAVAKKPSLIFVLTTPAASEAIKITNKAEVPLVYTAVTDPISAKIVTSMNKSETLATGVSDRYPVKEQVKVFLSILPSMKSCGILYNPSEENSQILVKQTIEAMLDRDVKCIKYQIHNASEIASQTKKALIDHDCLIVNGDNLATENLSIIINLCIKNKKPLFVGDPDSVKKGALATVGPSYYSIGLKSGFKAAQILSGISPKDIPSEYPSSFDYLINTSAAKKMGVSIPLDFLYSRELWISSAKSTSK